MNKLRSKSGMTLTELISGIIVLLLVAGILTVGVRLGAKAYVESVSASEAQVLCSTLTQCLRDEFRYAETTTQVTEDGVQTVKYFSKNYGGEYTLKADEDGQLMLYSPAVTTGGSTSAEKKYHLLSSKAYPYGLKANATVEYQDTSDNDGNQTFVVTLNITGSSGNTLATTSFEVRKVNP